MFKRAYDNARNVSTEILISSLTLFSKQLHQNGAINQLRLCHVAWFLAGFRSQSNLMMMQVENMHCFSVQSHQHKQLGRLKACYVGSKGM